MAFTLATMMFLEWSEPIFFKFIEVLVGESRWFITGRVLLCLDEKTFPNKIDLADWIDDMEGEFFKVGRLAVAREGLGLIPSRRRLELNGMFRFMTPSASRSCIRSLRTLFMGPFISGSNVRFLSSVYSITDTSSG